MRGHPHLSRRHNGTCRMRFWTRRDPGEEKLREVACSHLGDILLPQESDRKLYRLLSHEKTIELRAHRSNRGHWRHNNLQQQSRGLSSERAFAWMRLQWTLRLRSPESSRQREKRNPAFYEVLPTELSTLITPSPILHCSPSSRFVSL